MRKQIAAANWKMNLTLQQGELLLDNILKNIAPIQKEQEVIFAVPFPYLPMALEKTKGHANVYIAAQNLSDKEAGAYTGEVSALMLRSLGVSHVLVGHSERREYFLEKDEILKAKVDIALAHELTVIFCCGEPLSIREKGKHNEFVQAQVEAALFHLTAKQLEHVVIAYEPIWAIGTGKTATAAQAQEIQAFIRQVIAGKYDAAVSSKISILYGGSVNAATAPELFAESDIDGGLVGGASLKADDFAAIVKALK